MPKNKKKFITPQMFDIRPVNEAGDLDLEKIKSSQRVLKLESKRFIPPAKKRIGNVFYDIKKSDNSAQEVQRFEKFIQQEKEKEEAASFPHVSVTDNTEQMDDVPVDLVRSFRDISPAAILSDNVHDQPIESELGQKPEIRLKKTPPDWAYNSCEVEGQSPRPDYFDKFQPAEKEKKKRSKKEKEKKKSAGHFFETSGKLSTLGFNPQKTFRSFAVSALAIFLLMMSVNFVLQGLRIKNISLSTGAEAYSSLVDAQNDIASHNFDKAASDFSQASDQFKEISTNINGLGGIVIDASQFLPYASKLSSGAHLAKAGQDISQIGVNLTALMKTLDGIKNPLNQGGDSVSLLAIFQNSDKNLRETSGLLQDLEDNLKSVNTDDIPVAQRQKFSELDSQLPEINSYLNGFLANDTIFTDVLGGNGERKYLILFQNNQEMRATGGFIGTYGILDINNGQIKNFFMDGIYNPDGQLKDKIVPPVPIQKISAAWSLHDSNWFPNFPTSAEKAEDFYQKDGGPTVDGVITLTPTVLQQLLAITGPIDMPDYGVTIDKDNFITNIEQEVEVNYDKTLNQPKKILSDLAPKLLDKIFSMKNLDDQAKILNVLYGSLNQKQILLYSNNYNIESTISQMGWSGEILNTDKDYLSVINTNINGFKTDGVIDESITHQAQIADDGSITDTVTVTRHHNGGQTPYDFWNKVNDDYMRVYVPKGSKLISVSGATREFDQPPLDYDSLGFKRDPQVQMEEDSTQVDSASGTRIYEDSGKTVFANWVYVSPQETVQVKYTYLLPFRINLDDFQNSVDTYSLLAQKQSGSIGSKFSSEIDYPNKYKVEWKYPDNISMDENLKDNTSRLIMSTDLATDKFIGVALTKN